MMAAVFANATIWLAEYASTVWLLGDLEKWLPVFPVVVLIVVGAIAVFSQMAASASRRKRTESIQKAAEELALSFSQAVSYEQMEQLVQFPLLQRGANREYTNVVMAETDQLRLMLLDHKYVTGSGKNRSTHRQSVSWVSSSQLNIPSFNLYPETWFHRMGDLLLKRDIDFDEDPIFSHKFVLSGSDQAAIREFFDARRRQALLKINLPNIEAVRHGFVFYRPGKLVDPGELKSLMNEAFSLYQAFAPVQP